MLDISVKNSSKKFLLAQQMRGKRLHHPTQSEGIQNRCGDVAAGDCIADTVEFVGGVRIGIGGLRGACEQGVNICRAVVG